MRKYGLHSKLMAREGSSEKLTEILIKASQLVATAPGCRLYVIGKDDRDKNAVWVTEIWDSREDHDNALKIAGVRELIAQAMPFIDGLPEKGQELEILGGAGI